MDKLQWSAPEYEEQERSPDWFWALGIIIVTSSIAAIIFKNYFFALLLIIGGALLAFFAVKKPEAVTYELNEKGLKIGGSLYPYESIKSFWVQVNHPDNIKTLKSILFIKSGRVVLLIISIPIEDKIAEEIHSIMTAMGVAEEEMREHPSENIMESLGS